jgi:hypothetical protein
MDAGRETLRYGWFTDGHMHGKRGDFTVVAASMEIADAY